MTVVASHPAWAVGAATVEIAQGEDAEVTVRLQSAGSLRGRVLSADGSPIKGARVDAMPATPNGTVPEPEWSDPHWKRRVVATTNDAGEFVLARLPVGNVDVLVRGAGFRALERRAQRVAGGEGSLGDLVLRAGGTIRGRFVDAAGQPASLKWGFVSVTETGSEKGHHVDLRGSTFTLEGLADETYDLSFYPGKFANLELKAVRPDGPELTLTLTRETSLVGHLVFPPGGVPVRALRYMSYKGTGGSGSSTDVDEEGRFKIDGLDPEAQRIEISAPGYPTHTIRQPSLTPGESLEVTIVLKLGGSVRGRTVDAKGQPLAEVSVTFAGSGDHAVTGPDGTFHIRGIPGGTILPFVWIEGYTLLNPQPVTVTTGGEVTGVTLTLEKTEDD